VVSQVAYGFSHPPTPNNKGVTCGRVNGGVEQQYQMGVCDGNRQVHYFEKIAITIFFGTNQPEMVYSGANLASNLKFSDLY
jgi:hypothetical protein